MAKIREHDVDRNDETEVVARDDAYDKFGGTNAGAGFFGWLVAVAVTALLTGIIGAVAAAVGDAQNITQNDAQREAGTVGLVSAIVLIAVLVVGYYAGGYVAGRMSRFDGARQGVWVWAIGLIATVVAVVAGWAFGAKYNVLDRVSLPRIPVPHDQLTTGGILTAIIVLAGTLLAAVAGGKVGQHYHARVDRYADRVVAR
jgi:MFS family permease